MTADQPHRHYEKPASAANTARCHIDRRTEAAKTPHPCRGYAQSTSTAPRLATNTYFSQKQSPQTPQARAARSGKPRPQATENLRTTLALASSPPKKQDPATAGPYRSGEGGIRTPVTDKPPTRIPAVRLQPLSHLSVARPTTPPAELIILPRHATPRPPTTTPTEHQPSPTRPHTPQPTTQAITR